MARTSAKAKKQKQDANKTENGSQKVESKKEVNSTIDSDDASGSTDKENDNSNYEVEEIVHTRIFRGKRQYLVRWKGFKEDNDTWENESAVHSCTEALEAFRKKNPILNEVSKSESDIEAEDEKTSESNMGDTEEKGKKKIKKTAATKVKKTKKTTKTKKGKQEEQAKTESEDENQENSDYEGPKEKKRAKGTKTPDKKLKLNEEPQSKKTKTSEDSDNESVTDGKNYEVEKIIEVHTRKDGRREFLIRWKGYKPSDDTWEPEAHLDCSDLIAKFMEKVDKAKSVPARELRETRTKTNRYIPYLKIKGHRSNLRNSGYRPSYQE